jgi:DNA primase
MSATDEIKARLDIVNYIQQYAPLKKSGRHYKACCPFHNEKTPSFIVNAENQSWRCYGACAEGGDIFNFAMKQHGWSFPEALRELGRLAGVQVEQQTPEQRQQAERLDGLRGLMQAAADFYHQHLLQTPAVLAYAQDKRGFTPATISAYGIGYAPDGWTTTIDHLRQLGYEDDALAEVGLARRGDTGRVYDYFRNRLVIPIRDERGRVIGFGARALADADQPKYLNSPQTPLFDKSRTLFGLDVAKSSIRDRETAVIVEGYMDVLQAHQAGFMNVVAQMGTAMTEPQLRLLVPRLASRIVLALDADAAGQNATMRSLEVARQALRADYTGRLAVDIRILQIPDAKDPDDLIRESPDRWRELVDNATPVADYVINAEAGALPPSATVQEREAAARRLLPLLVASENELYRHDNIQKLALRLRIAERDLLYWADEQARISQSRAPRRPSVPDAPPEPPPDYDDSLIPPGEADDYAHEPLPAEPVVAAPHYRSQTAACEAECLLLLLQQPDLYYQINRKFRELASGDEGLLNGPLADFCVDDFNQGEYRALMALFTEALAQDELEPVAYVQAQVDWALAPQLDSLLAGTLEALRPRLRHGLSVDLPIIMKQAAPVDARSALMKNALDLRAHRLRRTREELAFLLAADETDEIIENGAADDIHQQIMLSIKAKRVLDEELHQQARNLY